MDKQKNKFEIHGRGIETPYGYLYNPPKQSIQIIFLVAAFFTAIFLGWLISFIHGDLSDFAQGVIYFIYLLVFILGYGVWISWLGAIVFNSFKLPLLKAVYKFFIHKKKPESIQDILPSRGKATEILVRAQKATKVFFIISIPIGSAGGLSTMFMETAASSTFLLFIVMITSIVFGYCLSYFGRRGYLPFPEE